MLLRSSTIQPADGGHHGPGCGPGMVRGKVMRRHVTDDPDLEYGLFVANRIKPENPIFIAVHGIHRGMLSQARQFAPLIDAVGGVLVAPLFPKRRFPDYQRLGRLGRGDRADLALKRILADVSHHLGLPAAELVMFGYSGGGQFVHRFAMANPRQVKRMAIAAPGWFTFPDQQQPFPRGIGETAALPDVMFDPMRFLRIPTLVMVGENDVVRDANLRTGKKIGSQQGGNRLDRGRHWIAAMSAAASRFGVDTPFRFTTLPGCGHSFIECMKRGGMGRTVLDFLFPDGAGRHASSTINAIFKADDVVPNA